MSLAKGTGVGFTATGHYSDSSTAVLPLVIWSSSSDLIATVDVGIGLAQAVAVGSVTITAKDPDTGITGSASLTVTPAVLQTISVSPSVLPNLPSGFNKQFAVTGRLTDGTTTALSTGLTWSTSNGAIASVAAGLVHAIAAGGPVTITVTEGQSGLSDTATVTVVPPPTPTVVPSASLPSSGTVDGSGVAFFHVTGLSSPGEYLVRVATTPTPTENRDLLVEVEQDGSFTTPVSNSWAGGPPCHAGAVPASGDLFVMVSGATGTAFKLDVSQIQILSAGGPSVAGSVFTENYFKIAGPSAAPVQVTLSGLSDPFADLYVYSVSQPADPLAAVLLLCSTVLDNPLASKSCNVSVPAAGVYVTVEAWLTGTAGLPSVVFPGTDFTLSAL